MSIANIVQGDSVVTMLTEKHLSAYAQSLLKGYAGISVPSYAL